MDQQESIYYPVDDYHVPFKVCISGNSVKVYARPEGNFSEYQSAYNILVYSAECQKIFIGKSPKNKITMRTGSFGPSVDGNTILLHVSNLDYTFIGSYIFKFTALAEIVEYVSVVDYPWARDINSTYYLMTENATMGPQNIQGNDIYKNFYRNIILDLKDKQFYIGNSYALMKWVPDPSKEYDLLTRSEDSNNELYLIDNCSSEVISKTMFISMICQHGKLEHLQKLKNYEQLVGRQI